MAMIRKQLYLADEQQRKIRRIATRRGCTEAEVVREAIDRLPEPGDSLDDRVVARLAAAGMLAPPPDDADLPTTDAEIEQLEQELDAWLETQTEPLGLSQAVWEDREGR